MIFSIKYFFLGVVGAIIISALFFVAWDYYKLLGEKTLWEGKYEQMKQAQETSEKEITRLYQKREQLDQSLVEWRQELEVIRKQTAGTQTALRSLANANKEVRDILQLSLPVDLHRVLWPKSAGHDNNNKDRKGVVPSLVDTGISGAP